MAMTYYVLKRCLAGLETTPAVLDRKMGLFTSMQRAHKWYGKLSSIEWVKMLANGDNLSANLLGYSDAIPEAMNTAIGAGLAQAAKSGVYFSLQWKGAGHGVGMAFDTDTKRMLVFDPNLGLFEITSLDEISVVDREFGRLYTSPGRIGSVVLSGTPRDLRSLGSN